MVHPSLNTLTHVMYTESQPLSVKGLAGETSVHTLAHTHTHDTHTHTHT